MFKNVSTLSLDGGSKPVYRSSICPRSAVITSGKSWRHRVSNTMQDSFVPKVVERPLSLKGENDLYSYSIPMKPKLNLLTCAKTLDNVREKETYQLSRLNDKFAIYIEKIRFLEAQNKRIETELKALNEKKLVYMNNAKEMYKIEISEAEKLLADIKNEITSTETSVIKAEETVQKMRIKLNEECGRDYSREQKVADVRSEITIKQAKINMLNMQLSELEEESKRQKHQIQINMMLTNQLSDEIQSEMLMKASLETEKDALRSEMNRLNGIYACELEELKRKILAELNVNTPMVFRNELSLAIENIRDECEMLNEQKRNELRNAFITCFNNLFAKRKPHEISKSVQERNEAINAQVENLLTATLNEIAKVKSTNDDLKTHISKLQEALDKEKVNSNERTSKKDAEIEDRKKRLEELIGEYEDVMAVKVSLENEIKQYHDLLEGSDSNEGLRHVVQKIDNRSSVVI